MTTTETDLPASTFIERADALIFEEFARLQQHRTSVRHELRQQTWLKYLRAKGRREIRSPLEYVRAVAHSVCVDFIALERRRAKRELVDTTIVAQWGSCIDGSTGGGVADEQERVERRQLLRRLVASLPEQQRQILLCAYRLDMNTPEISARLNLRPNTVRVYKKRALAKIRRGLTETLGADDRKYEHRNAGRVRVGVLRKA